METTSRQIPTKDPIGPISIGRPRWTIIALVAGVVVFWAGVILKIVG